MITRFEDFCTWLYVVVDDVWREVAPRLHRPGPAPTTCSDSEVITMAMAAECRGWDQETEALAHWRSYPHLFPRLPERSRFNRRRRALQRGIALLRRVVLRLLDVAADRQCAIDSLPIPVVHFHGAPAATREWAVHGAAYGTIGSKRETIYGYRLVVLVTLGGVILDYELVPADAGEPQAGFELLSEQHDLTAVGDKGFISAPLAEDLRTTRNVRLLTPRRRNQRQQWPPGVERLLNHHRQIIETVNGQLEEQFHIETNHAHSFDGLCARLHTKLAAHTLCLYLNRLLGAADWRHIKPLALAS